jgi:hypothetical protein
MITPRFVNQTPDSDRTDRSHFTVVLGPVQPCALPSTLRTNGEPYEAVQLQRGQIPLTTSFPNWLRGKLNHVAR